MGARTTAAALNPEAEKGAGACAEDEAILASSSMTTLLLPSPPSTNNLFRNTRRGRVKSEHYERWISEAGWRLKLQRPAPVLGPVVVLIGVERTNTRADIDNRIKPTLDLLVAHQLIKDDSLVIGVAAAWSPAANGLMRVAIIPASDLVVRFQLADVAHGGWFLEAPTNEGTDYGDQP